jgi:hypothetical protein
MFSLEEVKYDWQNTDNLKHLEKIYCNMVAETSCDKIFLNPALVLQFSCVREKVGVNKKGLNLKRYSHQK